MSFRIPPSLNRPPIKPHRKPAEPVAEHFCHARGCARPVPAQILMCAFHWRLVPRELQQLVTRHWHLFRSGKELATEYLEVRKRAIQAVAEQEGLV